MPSLRPLSQAHRLAQAALGHQTSHLLKQPFQLLDPGNLNSSFDQLFTVTDRVVQAQRLRSSRLAAQFLNASRLIAIGQPFAPVLADPASEEGLRTSMRVTGPVALRNRLDGGIDLPDAMRMTFDGYAASAARWVLNGGRETITSTIKADRRLAGYERVTSGSACEFCDMLAGRGAVYSEDAADFEAHDHCSCSAEPVYA